MSTSPSPEDILNPRTRGPSGDTSPCYTRIERIFEKKDVMFLRLQPYKQSSLEANNSKRFKPHSYDPYRILRMISEVAYELELLKALDKYIVPL